MKIAFMPDTHFGEYDQAAPPTPVAVADAMEHCIAEAELAESVGFDGLWVPERHQRPETWWPNTVTLLAALAARPACQRGIEVPVRLPDLTGDAKSGEEFAKGARTILQR